MSKARLFEIGLGACISFFVLLAWASKGDPEKDNKIKKEAIDFYSMMSKIYDDVNARIAAGPQQIELSDEIAKMLANTDPAQAPVSNTEPQPDIQSVYHPLLKRFSVQDTIEWNNNYTPWEWLTGPLVEGIGNVNSSKFYYYDDMAYRIDKIRKGKLLAIITPSVTESCNMPVLGEDKTSFTSGNFSGWLFLANLTDGTIVAAYPLQVQSSTMVEFRSGGMGIAKLFDTNPEEAVKVDFQDKFNNAVNAPLMGKGRITLEGGSLF